MTHFTLQVFPRDSHGVTFLIEELYAFCFNLRDLIMVQNHTTAIDSVPNAAAVARL
jgi:hypothetical protein